MEKGANRFRTMLRSLRGRIILAMILLVLGSLAFLVPTGIKRVMEWNKPVKTEFEPVFSIQPEQVTGIDVRGMGERVSLEWRDDTWHFSHPPDARSNTRAVQYFLIKICQWVPEKKYSVTEQSGQEGAADAFGFRTQSVRYVLQDQLGKTYTVITGGQEKITNRIFAKVENSETIYLMPRIAFIDIDRLAYRLRDHRIFVKPLNDILRINFREDQSAITLEKSQARSKQKIMPVFGEKSKLATVYDDQIDEAGWNVIYPYKIPANDETVLMILETLSSWEAIQFVEESVGARTDLSKYGLSDPYGEISLLSENGRYPMEIALGKPYGEDGPVFVKTSMNSKIVQIRKEALQTVQTLFNQVPSRQLVYFLDQVGQIEVLTSQWRIAVVKEEDVWEASLQERLSHRKKQVMKRDYREKEQHYDFAGAGIIEGLLALEYIDTLQPDNPFYAGFESAPQVMKVLFFKGNGNLMEVFKLFEAKDTMDVFYLQRQSDGDKYLINRNLPALILAEIKKAQTKTTQKKKP